MSKGDHGTKLNCHQVGRLLEIDVASVMEDVKKVRPNVSWEDHTSEVGKAADFRCGNVGLEVKNLADHYARTAKMVDEGVISRFGPGDIKLLLTTAGLYTPKALDRLTTELDGFCEIPEQVGMGTSSHLACIRQFLLHLPSTLFSADELGKQKLLTARIKKLKKRLSKLYESLTRGARSLLGLFRRSIRGVTTRIMGEKRTFLIARAIVITEVVRWTQES